MRTTGLLCALWMCAAPATAQEAASAAARTGTSTAAQSAASDARNTPTHSSIVETGLLVVSREWTFGQPDGARQSQSAYQPPPAPQAPPGFQWREAMQQWAMFLAVEHSWRLFQQKTRSQLGGPFLSDYVRSVKGLGGWWDGDSLRVNYVGHPMQGSISGYIQIQNDPTAHPLEFGSSGAYWRSRSKALLAAAIYSTQFELGPLSEASIGNVGLKPGTMAWVDLLVTPLAGVGIIVAEDAVDRYVIAKAEPRMGRNKTRLLRIALNPNRSLANVIRFQAPWHRDNRGLVSSDSRRVQAPEAAGRRATDVRR